GLVLFRQRHQLYRRDYRAIDDAAHQEGGAAEKRVAAGEYDRRLPLRAPSGSGAGVTAADRFCQPRGHALYGADADFRWPYSAWRSARVGHVDGRDRHRRAARRFDARLEDQRQRAREVGVDGGNRFWHQPYSLYVVETSLALAGAPRSHRIWHDGSDGRDQHAFASHGSRPPARARNVALFYDVHWNGPHWRAPWRHSCGENRRAMDGGHWRGYLPCWGRHFRATLAGHA